MSVEPRTSPGRRTIGGGVLAAVLACFCSTCLAAEPQGPPAATATPPAQAPASPASPPTGPTALAPATDSGVIALLPPAMSRQRLTARDKFQIYVHRNYGPQNFILPAAGAGFHLMHPPPQFPRDWKDGGGAFGRWYSEQIAAASANRTAALLTQIVGHEDPRYVPSTSRNVALRTFHAIAFTFVDKTDSGHNTFALSSFAGAAAGGFMGMAFLPDGYAGATHAEQRALRGLATVAVRNITTEFRPQWAPILRRIHVPSILPEWWTRRPPPQP
jgi:hypothetical protein